MAREGCEWGLACSQAEALAQRIFCWNKPFAGKEFLPAGEKVALCEYPAGDVVHATVVAVRWRAELRLFTYAVVLSIDHPTAGGEVLQGLPRAAMVAWPEWQSWDMCAAENAAKAARRTAEWECEGWQDELEEVPLDVRTLRMQWQETFWIA